MSRKQLVLWIANKDGGAHIDELPTQYADISMNSSMGITLSKLEGKTRAAIRAATRTFGGHATLVRAPDHLRDAVDPFEPQNETVMALTRGIKTSFDPGHILNPGRMYAGI